MENKKFGNLNITKKTSATHADIQSNMIVKKGGRPKKKEAQKLTAVISLNVSEDEKNMLETVANSMGINVVTLVRLSLNTSLKNGFIFTNNDTFENLSTGNIVKQYAVPVTNNLKDKVQEKADSLMISISDLLKLSLNANGFYKKIYTNTLN